MDRNDRARFAELVSALASVFSKPTNEAMLEGYWVALSDLGMDDVEQGFARAMRECEFMPPPAAIRSRAGVVPLELRAEMAWSVLLDAIGSHGYNANVVFEDNAVGVTVQRIGGWEYVTGIESEELRRFTRREFVRLYKLTADCDDGRGPVLLEGAHPHVGPRLVECPYLPGSRKVRLEALSRADDECVM